MTATVTEATQAIVRSLTYYDLSATFGIVAILLLLMLLIQKELMHILADRRSRILMQAFNTVIVPLLLAFGFIVVMRFVVLLFPSLR